MTAQDIITWLGLEALPIEGGYYRETWRAGDEVPPRVLARRYERAKSAGTAIYYLLTDQPGVFSAVHRLPTDEVYHFYLGDPVQQLLLYPDGRHQIAVLGPNLERGQHVQWVVPRDVWQGSRLLPGGRFALLGTTMAPGFDPTDYEGGRRDVLLAQFPAAADLIRALTRPQPAKGPDLD